MFNLCCNSKVFTRMHLLSVRRLTITLILATILSGCGSIGNDDDTAELWSPFNDQSVWDVGDGRIWVEVSGYERGHIAGKAAEFVVDVENRREERTELDVCARLIDENSVVQEFNQVFLEIDPNQSRRAVIDATLDEDIEPRAYGFAVVVGDFGVIVHTIRVGIPDDEPTSWLDVDQLVCD